jgi:hypothetical protein
MSIDVDTFAVAENAAQSYYCRARDGAGTAFIIRGDGRVGIGTPTPDATLHVNEPSQPTRVRIGSTVPGGTVAVIQTTAATGGSVEVLSVARHLQAWGNLLLNTHGGFVGIGTANPEATVDVNGTIRTKAMELTGGADIAEMCKSVEALEPGTLVVADGDHEGQVRAASAAYDEAVLGIVSGAGGIKPAQTLRQEGTIADGDIPIAVCGRVWCKCDASYGAIKVGNLLTPSDTPGHAMKVTDKSRAMGAVVGKAMTSLAEGQGLVLVMITHQ